MIRYFASTTYFVQVVETIVTCLILVLAWARPTLGSAWFERCERGLHWMGRRPARSALAIAAGVVTARLLLLPLLPLPRPAIHDEFSYLLAAQTFASGRLTNAPHPFWRNFESVHILQQPTYMSMYPPGQGLVLALGIWLTGQAWTGVLFSCAVLCSVLFWALNAWMPSSWALAGALLAAIRWCLVSYWMNSFWGGTVPAIGGALIFGSVPRLVRQPNWKHASLLALGLVVLANTRPYEGLVCGVVSIGVLLIWSRRAGAARGLYSTANLLPVAVIFVAAAIAMLCYNSRVTGDPLVLPYVQDRTEYAIAPLYIWGKVRPTPTYNSESLERVYVAEADLYRAARKSWGIPEIFRKLKNIWIFFLGPLLTIPLISFLFRRRSRDNAESERKQRYVTAIVAAAVLASLQAVWFYPHYLAPALAPFIACLLFGFRELRARQWKGRPTGLFLSRAIPIGCLLMAAVPVFAQRANWHLAYWPLQWALGSTSSVHSPELEARLLQDHRKALVFVQYGPTHDPGYEWVYNAPDIDRSPIVWARSTNAESDAALIRYFHDRNAWLVRPDERPLVLMQINSCRSGISTHAGSC